MARGFGATYGVDSNDRIMTPVATWGDQTTVSLWEWRNGDGGDDARLWASQCQAWVDVSYYRFHREFSSNDGSWRFPKTTGSQWNNIVFTLDASSTLNNPSVYYNGTSQTLQSEVSSPAGSPDNADRGVTIGNTFSQTADYDGILAEFGLWDVVLNAGEIAALAAGAAPILVRPQNLILWTPFLGDSDEDRILGARGLDVGTAKQDHPAIVYPGKSQVVTRVGFPERHFVRGRSRGVSRGVA